VLGPEAFDAEPFLELLGVHGVPWAMREESRVPELAAR
jgi:hypothetical protein